MSGVGIGLKLAPQSTTVAVLRAIWRIAEEGGFDRCWNFDHFAAIPPAESPAEDVYEAWTLLGAMAEATSRVRIGCMVTGNTYRHPGVLAKMAVTVDHLSGGRLDVGIGAGWAEIEHRMLGLQFETWGWRISRLEEACRVLKLLWTEERPCFSGEHYRLDEAIANPKPVQQPHPPLWIGAQGERKTLRVVAQHADVWNGPGTDPEVALRKSRVLDEHCAAIGREPAAIGRSAQVRFTDEETLLRLCSTLVAGGFDDLIIYVEGGRAEGDAERIAHLVPRLRDLS